MRAPASSGRFPKTKVAPLRVSFEGAAMGGRVVGPSLDLENTQSASRGLCQAIIHPLRWSPPVNSEYRNFAPPRAARARESQVILELLPRSDSRVRPPRMASR